EQLKGKTVLITGGTGSFGKHFTEHLLANSKLKKLIIFSRDELKQSQMDVELNDERVRFFIGDVRDLPRLERAFESVDIVVHAAALKQVPALEYNPFEAVKTNILGSQNVIEAALDQGVQKVVLISTDKAAMPINLYGSTKLNVVGSRGSIIEKLILNRGAHTVHITDERMTRFWIDLEQAFHIVLFALEHMEGGEIFIPKALSMKLTDLFKLLAPKAKRNIIGIRPGEKVHEVLLTKEEARHALSLKDYFVVLPEHVGSLNQKEGLQKFLKQGKRLKPNYHFTSDTTAKRMSQKTLLRIVGRMEKALLGPLA
ncbi:MAG: UDP-N-acetylglucosamine 4,6-dehydratase, partial [Parcubacteria group bacterium GW2011_GWB1_55_9]